MIENMREVNVLYIARDLIFLVVFNLIFFMLYGVDCYPSVWIAYGFINLSYLMVLLTPRLVKRGKSEAVFGFALSSISIIYFIFEFIVGIVIIVMKLESWKVSFIVQLVPFAIYCCILISNLIANEDTANKQEAMDIYINYHKTISHKMSLILNTINDRNLKKQAERAYDAIRCSQVKSTNSVKEIEQEILSNLDELEKLVKDDDIAKANCIIEKIYSLAKERDSELISLN